MSVYRIGLVWACPHDWEFHGGLANDCIHQVGKDGCNNFNADCKNPVPHVVAPATSELVRFFELAREAADFLPEWGTPEEKAAYDSYVATCDEFLAALEGVE